MDVGDLIALLLLPRLQSVEASALLAQPLSLGPDTAIVNSASGSDVDDAGRGSYERPWRTISAARAKAAPDPTTRAEFLRPRTIIVLPGLYVEDVSVGTFEHLCFRLVGRVLINGKLTVRLSNAQRFGSTSVMSLHLIGDASATARWGNALDCLLFTVPGGAADAVQVFPNVAGVFLNGNVSDDANIPLTTNAWTLAQVQVLGSTTSGFGLNTPRMGLSRVRDTIFTRKTSVYQLHGNVYDSRFSDQLTVANDNGAPGNVNSNTSQGVYNCTFSATGTTKQIVLPAGAALRIDARTNYSLIAAGWTVTPNTVVVALQENQVAIVPV